MAKANSPAKFFGAIGSMMKRKKKKSTTKRKQKAIGVMAGRVVRERKK